MHYVVIFVMLSCCFMLMLRFMLCYAFSILFFVLFNVMLLYYVMIYVMSHNLLTIVPGELYTPWAKRILLCRATAKDFSQWRKK